MDLDDLPSPKLGSKRGEWESLFPYYAGFSKEFADAVIHAHSARRKGPVLDPWNGAGTTTTAAAARGLDAVGIDINPVMNVVARARAISSDNADILLPLGELLVQSANSVLRNEDPLVDWFTPSTANEIRGLANSIRMNTSGGLARLGLSKPHEISIPTAVMYVALFATCRAAIKPLRASNPTWIKMPKAGEHKVSVSRESLHAEFLASLQSATLHANDHGLSGVSKPPRLYVGDAQRGARGKYDLVLTSPPYCTRIDYAQMTKLELAIYCPDVIKDYKVFRRSFTGTTLTEGRRVRRYPSLGKQCNDLLDRIRSHRSVASSGYYVNTHADYYNKMSASIRNVCKSLNKDGQLVLVVQDSWYKDVHNDVPGIIASMCIREGVGFLGRRDFNVPRSMADVHKHRSAYLAERPIQESVLLFAA